MMPDGHPSHALRPQWHSLSTVGKDEKLILFEGSKILIPMHARIPLLKELHRSHSGPEKTAISASGLYFWPKMNQDIKEFCQTCEACITLRPSKQKTLVAESAKPISALTDVGMDLMQHAGKTYLIMVCRYTGWPWVAELKRTHAEDVISTLHSWFLIWGKPISIRSDGGPQFNNSKFTSFCRANKIVHELSSAYNPQSNGLAEAAVKNIKHLVKKTSAANEPLPEALFAFCNASRKDGSSPAELMFGRRLRGTLPMLADHLAMQGARQIEGAAQKDKVKMDARAQFNKSAIKKPSFSVGDKVIAQNPLSKKWNMRCQIVESRQEDNSFVLKDISGKSFIRNVRFLRKEFAWSAEPQPAGAAALPPPPEARRSARLQSGQVHSEYNRQ